MKVLIANLDTPNYIKAMSHFGAECVNIFAYQILAVRRVGRFIVGVLRIEKTETLVVLCG